MRVAVGFSIILVPVVLFVVALGYAMGTKFAIAVVILTIIVLLLARLAYKLLCD